MEDFKDCEEFEIRSKQSDISTTKQVEKYANKQIENISKNKKMKQGIEVVRNFDNDVFETNVAKISTNNSHDSGYRESSVIPELGIYKTSFGFAKQMKFIPAEQLKLPAQCRLLEFECKQYFTCNFFW